METVVCIAHGVDAFLLWYVCVQAGYTHRHKYGAFKNFCILNEVNEVCCIFKT